MGQPLTAGQANAVYDILVEHADAIEGAREGFVLLQTLEYVREYRFFGSLGSGGKFWISGGSWYVTAYEEDITSERQHAIDDTNVALAALKAGENA